jgi:hypothetical protein
MADTTLEFVIRTLKEGAGIDDIRADLKDLQTGLDRVRDASEQTNAELAETDRTTENASSNVQKLKMSYTEVLSAIGLAKQAFSAIEGVVDGTVGAFVDYAIEVDKGARLTGMAVEEYSRFIQVADDVGVSQASINTAFEAATKKGIATNIEGIGKLSDAYLELEPGLERSKFLTDNFGRSGNDLARVMELGSDKIKENSAAIEDGLVITEEAAKQAEALRIANDELNDSVQAVKLAIGQEMVPVVRQLVNVLLSAKSGTNELTDTLATEAGQLAKTSDSFEDYRDKTIASMRAAGVAVDETDEVLQGLMMTMWNAEHPMQIVVDKFDSIAEAARNADNPLETTTGKFDDMAKVVTNETIPALNNLDINALQPLDIALSNNRESQDELSAAYHWTVQNANTLIDEGLKPLDIALDVSKGHVNDLKGATTSWRDLMKEITKDDIIEKMFAGYLDADITEILRQFGALNKETEAWNEWIKRVRDSTVQGSKEQIAALKEVYDKYVEITTTPWMIAIGVTLSIDPADLAWMNELANMPDVTHKTIQVTVETNEKGGGKKDDGPPPRPTTDPGDGYEWAWNGVVWYKKKIKNYDDSVIFDPNNPTGIDELDMTAFNSEEGPGITTETPFTPPTTGYFGQGQWGTPGWKPEETAPRPLTNDEIYKLQLNALSNGLMTSDTWNPLEGYYYGTGTNEDYMSWYTQQQQKKAEDAEYKRWLSERQKSSGEWLGTMAKNAGVNININVQKLTDAEINRLLKVIQDAMK